jgi:small redox-active disulfide protein 2
MDIKILGIGCPSCQSMLNDVTRILARNGMEAQVEYVKDIERILSYGVMSTPVLVVDGQIVMTGHRGASKIEAVLKTAAKLNGMEV